MQKILMIVNSNDLRILNDRHTETGMGFQMIKTNKGFISVLSDGVALPCYKDPGFYDLIDLLAGVPIPQNRDFISIAVNQVFPNRMSALMALRAGNISPQYTGNAGAFPLISSYVLQADTVFYRYLNSNKDFRYAAGQLTAGTYLTTQPDQIYANTGFATVGRYALPIPLPACYVIQYELLMGTAVNVGTVAPAFGQAGGGVEVHLPTSKKAKQVGASFVSAY